MAIEIHLVHLEVTHSCILVLRSSILVNMYNEVACCQVSECCLKGKQFLQPPWATQILGTLEVIKINKNYKCQYQMLFHMKIYFTHIDFGGQDYI